MVPDSYQVNDGEVATFFAGKQGRLGRSMLGRRDLDDPATEYARGQLLEMLQQDVSGPGFIDRFSRQAAKDGGFVDGENAFQIHEYKLGGKLLEFLNAHQLAWEPANPIRGDAHWWAVHPVLGEAIMSTNAVALAQAHDLEIVTSDGPTHQALMGTTASDVYDTLIRQRVFGRPRSETGKVNDLMRFVIVSAFDLDRISPDEIADLSRQRRDVAALKAAILSEIEDVGAVPDREVWDDVLSIKAKEVVDEWAEPASFLSMFTKVDADEIAGEIQDTLKAVAAGAVSGAAATALVGALPGLAVGVIFGTVHLAKKWHDYKQPYRFLSSLTHKGARRRHILEASPA